MDIKKVVVTGASGFVGQNLLPFLSKRDNIVVPLSLRLDWRRNLSENYDAIIHLAGKAHDTNNTSNPEAYFKVNTELTKQVFETFLQSSARDFIFISSVKAVADKVNGVLDEQVTPDPHTAYGQSKLKAEEYVLSKNLPSEKRIFILRPCMIHGPGNKGNLNLLYKVITKGIPYPLAAFDNKRSFLSIQNLLFIINRLLLNPAVQGGIYNVSDDKPLGTNEVIKIMGDVSNTKVRLWSIPPFLMRFLAKVGDKLQLPLNSERMKKLTEDYIVSNEKIKKALNIKSLPVSSGDGLSETIKSFTH